MLHHNVFMNGGPDNRRNDGACPHRSVTERYYGTSEELRPLTLPAGYGYPTAPADKWKHRKAKTLTMPKAARAGSPPLPFATRSSGTVRHPRRMQAVLLDSPGSDVAGCEGAIQ
jgi:hypothetical protein